MSTFHTDFSHTWICPRCEAVYQLEDTRCRNGNCWGFLIRLDKWDDKIYERERPIACVEDYVVGLFNGGTEKHVFHKRGPFTPTAYINGDSSLRAHIKELEQLSRERKMDALLPEKDRLISEIAERVKRLEDLNKMDKASKQINSNEL